MPTACTKSADGTTCTPPAAFVDALCNGSFVDAALVLFAKGSPWTRAYLRGDVDGWYASGGGSARARLGFDEEVLMLRVRPAGAGGVVVGGGASYDVLRWDGACYTLDAGEVTMKAPPKPKHPRVPFNRLSEHLQAVLLGDAKVHAAYVSRGKECHGVTTGEVSIACERADHALGEAVIAYVTSGSALPEPSKLPGE
jgi:hypothetical protein